MKTLTLLFYALFLLPIEFCAKAQDSEPIKIGLIGLDTSHATASTKILNSGDVSGGKVVAGVPQSSPDIESSHTRVDGFVKTLTDD